MSSPVSQPWRTISTSERRTMAIGAVVARHSRPGDLIALVGPLGAGKTRFVAGLAEGLGIDPAQVASPTFVFVHEYEPPLDPVHQTVLVHVDAYRIGSVGDLQSIGWEFGSGELSQNAVVAVEWADRLTDELGNDYLLVSLEHQDEQQRCITLIAYGNWMARMAELCAALERLP